MSDLREQLEDNEIVIDAEMINESEQQEEQIDFVEQEQEEQVKEVSEDERRAREKGWIDRDEWIEQGRDPDEWGGYKAFNKNGSIIAERQRLVREHQQRIEDLNSYHALQLEQRISDLQSQQRDAAENADIEQFDKAQKQINELQNQAKQLQSLPGASEATQIENEWAANNPWIKEFSPKSTYANAIIQNNPNLTGQALIDKIENEMASAFPEQNPNRQAPSLTDKARPKPTTKREKPSMATLTAEERKMWSIMQNQNHMTEDRFLKVVANARKGE